MKILIVLAVCSVLYSCGRSEKQNQPQNKVESPKEEVVSSTSKPEKSIDDGNIYYKVDSVKKTPLKTYLQIKTQFPYKEDIITKIAEEMFLKSSNKNLVIFFFLKDRNEYSEPFASVNYPGKKVFYKGMYPDKIDVTKIKGKILGAWYNDESYNIWLLTKNQNKYEINSFNEKFETGEFITYKLRPKNKKETEFEEDVRHKGLKYTINDKNQLEVFSQDRNTIKGIYNPANLDSIKVK